MSMTKESIPQRVNPFVYGRPIQKSDQFFGRRRYFLWIGDCLNDVIRHRPLVISGADGFGKTSFANQLVSARPIKDLITVQIEAHSILKSNLRDFFWRVSQAISSGLAIANQPAPPLQKRMLILRPEQEFMKRYWRPLDDILGTRKLLLVFDNIDLLMSPTSHEPRHEAVLDIMREIFDESNSIEYLFFLRNGLREILIGDRVLFDALYSARLSNFDRKVAFEIIRQAQPIRIVDRVASYIYELTAGHPNDLQRLCHALFERSIALGVSHITLADVAVTLSTDLTPGDFQTAVFERRKMLEYQLIGT